MTHDQSGENIEQTDTAEGNVSGAAPSGSTAHDHADEQDHVHDDQGHGHDHLDAHNAHDAHDAHGGHNEEDDSQSTTLVPTTWRQLIFPVLILLIVIVLLIGPVSAAFAPRPAPPTGGGTGQPTVAPTAAPSGVKSQGTSAQIQVTPKSVAAVTQSAQPTAAPVDDSVPAPTVEAISPASAATRTAVAVLGESGQVSRAPVQLEFEGAQFQVDAGSGILPDWKPSGDATHATWIDGTYANHIIYLSYSDSNAALFSKVKTGDTIKLTMNSGQVFEFQVSLSQRASNGPATAQGQFTVTTAMNQDHAGVTLFLVGDPAPDRAVVQADFNGNIQ